MSSGPEIILQSTEVPCSHGEVLIVNPGDKWPAPYRGSRYTIRRMKKEDGTFQYRFCWTRQGGIHHRSIFKGLLRALREIRSDEVGGSIRITPWREVLCKKNSTIIGLLSTLAFIEIVRVLDAAHFFAIVHIQVATLN